MEKNRCQFCGTEIFDNDNDVCQECLSAYYQWEQESLNRYAREQQLREEFERDMKEVK